MKRRSFLPFSRLAPATAVFACLFFLAGCASWPRQWGSQPCRIERKPIVKRQPIWWHLFDVTVLDPLEQPFHVARSLRKLFGVPIRSHNLYKGEVSDTAFFTNRNPEQLTPEQVRWGPTRPEDLAVPPFTVTKAKVEGKTPGFFVTDARGVHFLFKLDPVDSPELLSGAEVVTSKLLYALGYHVPSYEVIRLPPQELRVSDKATAKSGNNTAPFRQEDLDRLLEGRLMDGRVRVASSKIISGEILGPARFKKFRDCTDMRALKLAYAWVNNIDAKDHNSLLSWDGQETVGFLFDFGTSLGADAGLAGSKTPCAGWTYLVDLKEVSLEVATLGLHQPVCDAQARPLDHRIGLFSARLNPKRWKPYAPNRAFKEMDDEDARWIARRISRLSPQQIKAAVSAGQYSQEGDAQYLTDVLEHRRVAILEHYLEDKEEEKAHDTRL